MVTVFVWSNDRSEWLEWCRCWKCNLPEMLEIAATCSIECDWIAW